MCFAMCAARLFLLFAFFRILWEKTELSSEPDLALLSVDTKTDICVEMTFVLQFLFCSVPFCVFATWHGRDRKRTSGCGHVPHYLCHGACSVLTRSSFPYHGSSAFHLNPCYPRFHPFPPFAFRLSFLPLFLEMTSDHIVVVVVVWCAVFSVSIDHDVFLFFL